MNKRAYITAAIADGEYKVLYMGPSKEKSRNVFLDNRENQDFDFVGMQIIRGFQSRSRPKMDATNAAHAAAVALTRKEESIKEQAAHAVAIKDSLADAALRADEAVANSEEDLKALKSAAKPASKKAPPDNAERSKKASSRRK